jgi:hypothetical protein
MSETDIVKAKLAASYPAKAAAEIVRFYTKPKSKRRS